MKKFETDKTRALQILIGAVALLLILGIVVNVVKQEKAAREEAQRQLEIQLAKEKEEEERKRQEEEKQAKIAEVLSKEKYQTELTEFYEKYPQLETVFLNREDYPDWLITYLVKHEDAIDWVVEYPEYMSKSEEELTEMAETPIPEDEDAQHNIPMLFQWDQRWGYLTYGDGTIAVEGCGPTCLSMAVIGLTGDRSVTPKVVADFAMEKGYYVTESGSSWSLMESGAKSFGLTSKQIQSWSTKSIKQALKDGKVVICSVGKGDFTSQGHFIVIVGLNEDGTVSVNDPNSRTNSEKTWEISRILDQTKGMWAIGK